MRTLCLALLVACSASAPDESAEASANFVSAETSACISGHPAAEPFDVGDATVGQVSAGGVPPARDSFVEQCRSADGTGCDESFISREAARCIAEQERFAPGLDPWSIGLAYQRSYHRVVWGVENVLVNRGVADYSGQSLTLDAVTGRVLGRTDWSVP